MPFFVPHFSWCPIFLVPYFLGCPIFLGALYSRALYSGALDSLHRTFHEMKEKGRKLIRNTFKIFDGKKLHLLLLKGEYFLLILREFVDFS